LFRAHVFERVGPFDETQRYCDDVEWFLRAQDAGLSMVSHPEVVWFYRQHDQNLTKQVDIHQQYLATAIRKALLRRRQREGGRGPG
jgi:GT2 family glycosyltransferase